MTSEGPRQMTEEEQRIRGFLVTQGEKRDWIELWPRFIGERALLLNAIERVSEEQADFKPDAESWSVRQVTEHVLASSRRALRLIEDLAAGRDADGREVDSAPAGRMPERFADLRRHLVEHSVRFTSLIERLPPSPNMELTAPHQFFGELNCRSWFLFQRVHDTDHRQQIEAVQAAPGYPEA